MSPTPVNIVPRSPLVAAVKAQLAAVSNAAGFLGEPVDVPTTDALGHVMPYWVLHTAAGTPSPEQDVADTAVDLDWWIQVTCAGAYPEDVTALVSRVDALLYRWEPAAADGLTWGPLRPPPGFDPGPVRIDRDVTPHRFYAPLQYQTRITR